ncbi:MAG: VWA domain-containing protein [Vicinamibacterales bacterium]
MPRHPVLLFTAALALAAMVGPASAQSSRTFRSQTDLVTINVSVQNDRDAYVANLTADQFAVFEDGVPQTIRFFASGDLPLDLVVLLDISGSMRSSLPLVQEAAINFTRAARRGDRVAVMGISNGLRILQPLTADLQAVEAAIRSSRAQGRTPLYSAVYVALRELAVDRERQREPRRQAIVVLSDGLDTASSFSFDDLLVAARRSAVPVYAIAPRVSQAKQMRRERLGFDSTSSVDYELRLLARDTGGRAFFPTTLGDLDGVYTDIAGELAHAYSVAFESSNGARDGRFRQLTVRVDAPGVRWRNRPGYQAPGTVSMTDLGR